ncbi:transposase [Komagataeibacter medellinensis NBRC 3288]|uniref:Transposase n=1 Tax=Komagataeibacter medellinensis (strain NBRC 3288 / BCRC 11682 / LMG 1693 / Kondo 51) TaxID=634177 RepID=G2I1E4_KOMMN|nr:transposase [Komagataeibacter medellinensis NBRC 3288]
MDAAASDGTRLREDLLDKTNTALSVRANIAYRSKANEDFMDKEGFVSKVHGKKPHLWPMPRHIQRSSAEKPVIRSRIEPVFAAQKSQMGLFVWTVGMTWVTMKIGQANIVYTMRCFLFPERGMPQRSHSQWRQRPVCAKHTSKVTPGTVSQNEKSLKS